MCLGDDAACAHCPATPEEEAEERGMEEEGARADMEEGCRQIWLEQVEDAG